MVLSRWSSIRGCFGVCLVAGLGISAAHAGDVVRQLKLDESAPVVDLFDGMDSGQVQVKLVVNSPNDAVVSIKNKTDAPLTIALPKAAVGVPVLPQLAFPGGNNFGGNNGGNQFNNNPGGNNNQANQAVGGQFQPMNNQAFPNGNANGNAGQQQGQNLFSIPPEKIVQLKMRTVCLNYGQPDPHAGVKYELQKLETAISNPTLRQLLEDYRSRVNQDVMQAAAWHLASGLGWDQLASLPSDDAAFDEATMYSANTLQSARTLVKQSEERAAERAKEPAAPPREIIRPVAKRQSAKVR